jgi:hypothetical protein
MQLLVVESSPRRIRLISEEQFRYAKRVRFGPQYLRKLNVSLAIKPQTLEGRMPSVARYGSTHVVENETGFLDIVTASKLAAESALPKLAETSATPNQRRALVEAMRLILIDEVEGAKSELTKGGFSHEAMEQIFPLLLSGLKEEAAA